MPRIFALSSVFVALCLVAMTGCQGPMCFPAAGTMDQQQASAVIHDPFPQNDIAPYEAASRPPGYQKPLPLPVRNRIAPDAFPWLSQSP